MTKRCLLVVAVMLPPMASAAQGISAADLDLAVEAGSGVADVFKLYIDESIRHTGTLTESTLGEVPASITRITARDIAMSPGRCLTDVIEFHVPGALWLEHILTGQVGLRGLVSDRMHKVLVLVNGQRMNELSFVGADSELDLWDLSDIAYVDVVRGPGAVTNGPGGVAGIISIVTKDADDADSQPARLFARVVQPYRSYGIGGRFADTADKRSIFGHVSLTKTQGLPAFSVDHTGDARDRSGAVAPTLYFSDMDGPQLKLHVGLQYDDHTRMWVRYTKQGRPANAESWAGATRLKLPDGSRGDSVPNQGTVNRTASVVIEHSREILPRLKIKPRLAIDSIGIKFYDVGKARPGETGLAVASHGVHYDGALYTRFRYSESKLLTIVQAEYGFAEDSSIALAFEYFYTFMGPYWGEPREWMNSGELASFTSGPGSLYEADDAASKDHVGAGWAYHTYALAAEAKLALHPRAVVHLAGRVDTNSYTPLHFSPRASIVSRINDENILKLIAQAARRMPTSGNARFAQVHGSRRAFDSETLRTVELIYLANPLEEVRLEMAGFINRINPLGFTYSSSGAGYRDIGDMIWAGVEAQAWLRMSRLQFTINHAMVRLLRFRMHSDITSSGISYADYRQPMEEGPVINGYGRAINNVPEHLTKAVVSYSPVAWFTIHANAQLFWGFQGNRDGLEALRAASLNTQFESSVDGSVQSVYDSEMYGRTLRFNASITVRPSERVDIIVFGQDLFAKATRNSRLFLDASGIREWSPHRSSAIRSAPSIGVTLSVAM